MKPPIYLLTDYRDHFYSSVRYSHASMKLDMLSQYFDELGYSVNIRQFTQIDLRSENFNEAIILYQSTEDRNLEYHDYIEDVLLALKLQGARLVPEFHYFRSHHNKVFMEILRDIHNDPLVKNIRTRTYGTLEEYVKEGVDDDELVVLKPAQGAKSSGVQLLKNRSDRLKHAKKISRTFNIVDIAKEFVKSLIRPYHIKRSHHRRKFLAQTLVPGLSEDYKIVVYGSRYYVLKRSVRAGDFRASGSGLFDWIESPPPGLLDYAKKVFEGFNVPFISIDVGSDGNQFYLFEFQFIHFGNTTVEKSSYYFAMKDGQWKLIKDTPNLEKTFAESVHLYLEQEKTTA